MDERTDAELVSAVLRGEVETYAVLVQRYRDQYTRFAVRMLGNADDADEALQRAFLRAYRALPQCDRARFGAWLYAIVANQCRTLARQRQERQAKMVVDDRVLQRAVAPARAASDAASDEAAWRGEIEYALSQLDVEQREAFVLKYVEERSYEEMAEVTGVGVSALKMRVRRACARLQELLKEEYHV
jgi:RNA polymerase sigma-70 factor (ECF subfamily)